MTCPKLDPDQIIQMSIYIVSVIIIQELGKMF